MQPSFDVDPGHTAGAVCLHMMHKPGRLPSFSDLHKMLDIAEAVRHHVSLQRVCQATDSSRHQGSSVL